MLKKLEFSIKHHHNAEALMEEKSEDPRDTIFFSNPDSDFCKEHGFGKEFMFGVRELEPGIYECGNFNFNHSIKDFTDAKIETYGRVTKDGKMQVVDWSKINTENFRNFDWDNLLEEYGVADNIEQVKEYYKAAIDSPDVQIVISFVEMRKDEQSPSGGWRWHKWGEYIGVHEITCEYLYDEPVVESVICFHAYVIKD